MRKKGKKHSTLTCLPPGFRRDTKFELPVRSALLAMENECLTEKHLYDLFVLAEMSIISGAKGHYLTHADSLRRVVCLIGDRTGHNYSELEAAAVTASAPILLEYIGKLSNIEVAKAALIGMARS